MDRARAKGVRCTLHRRPGSGPERAVVVCSFEPRLTKPRQSKVVGHDHTSRKGKGIPALDERDGAFIIPNPWDLGTARILAHLGFEALATTSMGFAFSVGQPDTTIDRDRMIAHVAAIAKGTNLPVSADLENGYGDSPETVARDRGPCGVRGSCRLLDRRRDRAARRSNLRESTRGRASASRGGGGPRACRFHSP